MRVNIIKLKTFFLILLENALQMRANDYNKNANACKLRAKVGSHL